MAVVLIEGKIKSKFVLVKNPSELTAEDITSFVESWNNGDAKKYGITDEVKVEAEQAEAEELWLNRKIKLKNLLIEKYLIKWVSILKILPTNTAP